MRDGPKLARWLLAESGPALMLGVVVPLLLWAARPATTVSTLPINNAGGGVLDVRAAGHGDPDACRALLLRSGRVFEHGCFTGDNRATHDAMFAGRPRRGAARRLLRSRGEGHPAAFHGPCRTCGYSALPAAVGGAGDCVSCGLGFELDVQGADCTGFCVPLGTARRPLSRTACRSPVDSCVRWQPLVRPSLRPGGPGHGGESRFKTERTAAHTAPASVGDEGGDGQRRGGSGPDRRARGEVRAREAGLATELADFPAQMPNLPVANLVHALQVRVASCHPAPFAYTRHRRTHAHHGASHADRCAAAPCSLRPPRPVFAFVCAWFVPRFCLPASRRRLPTGCGHQGTVSLAPRRALRGLHGLQGVSLRNISAVEAALTREHALLHSRSTQAVRGTLVDVNVSSPEPSAPYRRQHSAVRMRRVRFAPLSAAACAQCSIFLSQSYEM